MSTSVESFTGAPGGLQGTERATALALALLWAPRPQATLLVVLRQLGPSLGTAGGVTPAYLKAHLGALVRAGLAREDKHRGGVWVLTEPGRSTAYRQLLAEVPEPMLRAAIFRAENYLVERTSHYWPLYDFGATVGVVHYLFFAGSSAAELERLRERVSRLHDWELVMREACYEGFDAALFERVNPSWRWGLALHALDQHCRRWDPGTLAMTHWVLQRVDNGQRPPPDEIRVRAAEVHLHRGETALMLAALIGDESGYALALRAAALVQAGQWALGQEAFEAALRQLKEDSGARKRLLPESLAWYYPLALMAQNTTRHLELARRFCLAESGTRAPRLADWGLWHHVLGVRLGHDSLQPAALQLQGLWGLEDLWRCLLRAWLGRNGPGSEQEQPRADNQAGRIQALLSTLRLCGLRWLEGQLLAAQASLAGKKTKPDFFIPGPQERWRGVLDALKELASEEGSPSPLTPEGAPHRLLWALRLGADGTVLQVEPLEQKRGARGWGKPRRATLSRVMADPALQPWDARVARAIRESRAHTGRYHLDRAAAVQALVGHPGVVLADAPEALLEVTEGKPELEVVRQGEGFFLRMHPAIHEADPMDTFDLAQDASEREALRLTTVLRDSPQRLRVIRLTPAQRRAALMLGGQLGVPAQAQPELEQTLQALSGHFQIHAEHARAAREVEPETRLRAELSPQGTHLLLRLVATPLGADGPRLPPGSGRERLMTGAGAQSVGTKRDLDGERAHLGAVLEALPFLEAGDPAQPTCEWLLEDPAEGLDTVERLPKLPSILALDWPRGRPVRVLTLDKAQLGLKLTSERDWFRLTGQATVDEGLVLKLEELLSFVAKGSGRFVPMGEGVYAALTGTLRSALLELAAVSEADAAGQRVPQIAAAWVNDLLEGTSAQTDAKFRSRLDQLQAAQERAFAVPATLQAQLRPYQEDGFLWAARLAEAGFGACLADDMGLGKTLQALGVLLARGSGGPALVVAPTSVCGNWLEEAQRFAPSLNLRIYGEGARARLIEDAGPLDVLVVSYTLLMQAREAFAARPWHTIVADEAQAIKNASAKRAVALFDLDAGFRLALSGTPVENRLAELWSIMRFCNPGLLGTLTRFNQRFAVPIERDRDRAALQMLRRLIGPFILRRTKAQVLKELPPRTELTLTITPDAAEAAHYEALRRRAMAAAQKAANEDRAGQARLYILAEITRLRRAACDPRLVSPGAGISGAKVAAFTLLASELVANGHKALVFSQFVDFLTLLRAPLDEAGIAYQYLDGSTPASERTRRVAAFQAGEADLFLISLKAGGFGLNLTAADYVVIADPWWNPAAEDQAMGRAHRIGQLRPVTVYRLVNKGTLEESIVLLHNDKRALAEGILAEGEGSALPSTDDLIALMRGDARGIPAPGD